MYVRISNLVGEVGDFTPPFSDPLIDEVIFEFEKEARCTKLVYLILYIVYDSLVFRMCKFNILLLITHRR